MAKCRMFCKEVMDDDKFADMPFSAQALYVHLNMQADDDGFISNQKRIQRSVGASSKDLKRLETEGLIHTFESGVAVILHWHMHNKIRKDRYIPTKYQEELACLRLDKKGAYFIAPAEKETGCEEGETPQSSDNQDAPICQPNDNQTTTKCKPLGLGKREEYIYKEHIERVNTPTKDYMNNIIYSPIKGQGEGEKSPSLTEPLLQYGEFENVLLTADEFEALHNRYLNADSLIEKFSVKLKSKGYKYDNHFAALIDWAESDKKKSEEGKKKATKGANSSSGNPFYDAMRGGFNNDS